MANIVYGVAGEGSGHSSRARELATHLREQGHAVRLASYDRGYRNLKDDFEVCEIEGLTIASHDNRVWAVKAFVKNLQRLPAGRKRLKELRRQLFDEFQPDCVITDFEPLTAYLANYYDQPTFKAFQAISPRPVFDAPVELDKALAQNAAEVWEMLQAPDTCLYLAGVNEMFPSVEKALIDMAGSIARWQVIREKMKTEGRWNDVLY